MMYKSRHIDLMQSPTFTGKFAKYKSLVNRKFPGLYVTAEVLEGTNAASYDIQVYITNNSSQAAKLTESTAKVLFRNIAKEAGLKLQKIDFIKHSNDAYSNKPFIRIFTYVTMDGSGKVRGNINPLNVKKDIYGVYEY